MTLSAGTRLGPYEILAPLGAGGMGEVYRARDTRLERIVAVKVLSPRMSASSETRKRFEREAKTISQLSHPHVCALHDVGREGETEYLVMEYLEGETLSARLARGALPPEQTLRYGQEIADALDKAHRQGIVHRDLKPGNVMLTKTGVKLLDFGLAKLLPSSAGGGAAGGGLSAMPTQQGLTQEGTILGTFQYMAPEQLEGREADARTDIFALGAVLYEMATGKKAFSGVSQASLITAIMSGDPPSISSVQPMSPAALDRVVRTCLAKDPEDRWQSAGDIAKELKWIGEGSAAGVAAPMAVVSRRRSRERIAWAVAAAAVLVAVTVAVLSRRSPLPGGLTRFTVLPPAGQNFAGATAISPDARRVLFQLRDELGKNSIALRDLDRLEMRRLPGTERARGMLWSPDGRDVAFFSEGRLKRMSAEGGPVQTVCESGFASSGTWSSQGVILFTERFGAPISAVSVTGGTPRAVTTVDTAKGEVAHFHPSFLPDGRHFAFVARHLDPEKTSVMLASLDSGEVRPLFRADSAAVFADPGYFLFARDSAVFAWKFDPRRLELSDSPFPLLEQVLYQTSDNATSLSVAENRLVYVSWNLRRSLVWVDRKGRELGTLGAVGGYLDVHVSPNGEKVAVTMRDASRGRNMDVWVLDASRGTASRITAEPTDEFNPSWSPDGESLVYVSDQLGFYDIYETPAIGGSAKVLVRTKEDKTNPSLSRDGRQVLLGASEGGIRVRMLVPLSGGEPLRLTHGSRFSESHPTISPDGRWTAFDSDESGPTEVYVQLLPDGPKRQVSIGGGTMPIWSRNGSEVFYVARDGMLMSVDLRLGSGRPEAGEPQPLFYLGSNTAGRQYNRHPYDVSLDGQRFVVIRPAPGAEPDSAVVVTNWTALLKAER